MRLFGVWALLVCCGIVGFAGCVNLEGLRVSSVSRASASSPVTAAGAPLLTRVYPLDDRLRLNQIQVKATHNSYHLRPPLAFAASHRYSQPSLQAQLERHGVRGFELDIHEGASGEIEVYHIRALDSRSSCRTLRACLTTIREWSDAHRQHVALAIWIEVKDFTGGRTMRELSAVDSVIREVFDETRLITPDSVQAGYASPRARVRAEGWPTLGETRGRVLFALLNPEWTERYTGGYRSLKGKAMFAVAAADQRELPWALVTKYDDPREADSIRDALRAGLLVATNTCGAGDDDAECEARLHAALANGPQTLHDDYPASVASRRYWLDVPDARPGRCNPITAPPECTSAAIE